MNVYYLVFPCKGCGKEQTLKEVHLRNEPNYCRKCRPKKRAKKEVQS